MFAKNLEALLIRLYGKGDVSRPVVDDMAQRFEALRRYRRLPNGRERRAQALNNQEIAAAILGLTPVSASWAGHVALVLGDLRPVGGPAASFFAAKTLSEAIGCAITNPSALASFDRMFLSAAEYSPGLSGHASILCREATGALRKISFVSKLAVSKFQPGAGLEFDAGSNYPAFAREIVINKAFMKSISAAVSSSREHPVPLEGDGSEYDSEELQQARLRRLGVLPNSQFLNVPVDNQVTWPREEAVVSFDRYKLVLLPKTRDTIQSVHIDLTANRLSIEGALTVVYRFLSVMTWCDDSFAIAQESWAGNPVPAPVPKRDLAFITTPFWVFSRSIPATEEARRALALFREARNGQQNFLVSYAVLNYFKIIEIRHHGRAEVKKWFKHHYAAISSNSKQDDEVFERFERMRGSEKAEDYIYRACRTAVAHAGREAKSDPDDVIEVQRLHMAADVLHILARHFIKWELNVSDLLYSDVLPTLKPI